MPITVRVVSDQEFSAWVDQAKQKFASSMPEPIKSAGNPVKDEKLASAETR
jgi:cytochrome c oxidase subunit 2